jgi:hypothetical protein
MRNEAAERLRERPAIGSPRDYVETKLLDLISNHGGQTIVAGPEMDALRQEIADWHDAALAAERRATVEPIEILMEHWRREAEAITGAMLENPNNVTGLHAARAAALNEVVVALYPIILDAEAKR